MPTIDDLITNLKDFNFELCQIFTFLVFSIRYDSAGKNIQLTILNSLHMHFLF